MSSHYLLDCECGRQLSVSERQAGQAIACQCGNSVPVPSLRQLRHLPHAARADRRKSAVWSRSQGFVFAAGCVVMGIALCVLAYYSVARWRVEVPLSTFDRFLDQQDPHTLTPAESWLIWQAYEHYDLGWGHSQGYLDAKRRAARLSLYMAIAAGAACLGGIVMAIALFGLKPRRRSGR